MAVLDHLYDTHLKDVLSALSPGEQLAHVLSSLKAPVTRVAAQLRARQQALAAVRKFMADPQEHMTDEEVMEMWPILGSSLSEVLGMAFELTPAHRRGDGGAVVETVWAMMVNSSSAYTVPEAERAYQEACAQRGAVLTVLDLLAFGTIAYRDEHHLLVITDTEVQLQRIGHDQRMLNFPGILNAILTRERLVHTIKSLLLDMDFAAVENLISSVAATDNARGPSELRGLATRFCQGLDQDIPPELAAVCYARDISEHDNDDEARLLAQRNLDRFCSEHGVEFALAEGALQAFNDILRLMFTNCASL